MSNESVTDQAARRWDAVKGDVGLAVHESFKARNVRAGYPDHRYVPGLNQGGCRECQAQHSAKPAAAAAHHTHMVAWADLPATARESYIRQGEVPWMMGYLAALHEKGAS